MRDAFARLEHGAVLRSTGRRARRAAGVVQLASAVAFVVTAAVVKPGPVAVLLWLEALGQVLLALENVRSGSGAVVRYFAGPSGGPALVVFAATVGVRAALGAGAWPSALAATLLLAPLVRPTWPRDLLGGLGLVVSALGLATALAATHPAAAVAQAAYAGVLVLGVVALKPWQAELLNVPVFVAFALCF